MTGDADQLTTTTSTASPCSPDTRVVHQQGRGESHGDKLTYNTQTGYMTGESGNEGQVHMTFLPKQKPLPPAKHGAATCAGGDASQACSKDPRGRH
jgi:lipopolysaccharide export system protein LptA